MSPAHDEALIEALAKRLHDAYWIESGGHAFELGELDRRDNQLWKAVARECLSQMKWARGLDARSRHLSVHIDDDTSAPWEPPTLTLAPEGWTP